ncbi:MAG: bifunctional glycosyltransferase/class I SAM-dependent methyltransferase [Sedimentisphaerales bacterium]
MMDDKTAENLYTDKKKVLIFIVCYNAESTIEAVLDRIPQTIWNNEYYNSEVLIIDDQSFDKTFDRAHNYCRLHPERHITVLYNPRNQGYGGNQKIGYCYAIKQGFDAVVLLHGDGQYAPEYLDQMIKPIIENEADVVFGSRMINRISALKGRMPFYKWIGNQILTSIQNKIIKSRLSEFHSGYRAYSIKTLSEIPFEFNSNYFDFDTDIIIQLVDTGKRIKEIPIPTFYGDEICRVNGIRYAIRIIGSCIRSRLNKIGLYYHPKFDYGRGSNAHYESKFGYASSQQFALDNVKLGATVIDIGCGPGFIAEKLKEKGVQTVSIDLQIQPQVKENSWKYVEADVEKYDFNDDFGKVDCVLALDIIEHLKSPEQFLLTLRQRFSKDNPAIIITTGNIAFLPMRLSLLWGSFNYGKRGILDLSHTRLFSFYSLIRTLENAGYEVVKKQGIPAPFPLAVGRGKMADFLLWVNKILILISKALFSYQIAVMAKPLPTLEHLLDDAHKAKDKKIQEIEEKSKETI